MKVVRMINNQTLIREIRDEDYEKCRAIGWTEYNPECISVSKETEDEIKTDDDFSFKKKKRHKGK